jgi:hypothetical protein
LSKNSGVDRLAVLFYSPHIGKRLAYAVRILFNECGVSLRFTSDLDQWKLDKGVKACFTKEVLDEHSLFFYDSGWLCDGAQDLTIPPLLNNNGPLAWDEEQHDVLSSVFYLITRYEEYTTSQRDALGRFDVQYASCAPTTPHIDRWRLQLIDAIQKLWPDAEIKYPPFYSAMTVDVDSAFAFRHKGWKRTLGGQLKDIYRADFKNFFARNKILFSKKPDPYDTYSYMVKPFAEQPERISFFFLLANFGTYDKNVPHTSKALQRLIQTLASQHAVGIHPGVASNDSDLLLSTEIQRLSDLIEKPVVRSRQHYLKLQFPSTYERLLKAGITADYSMGYSGDTRFRAGTTRPYYWYHVGEDRETPLLVHPFVAMEATLKNYLHLSPDDACLRLEELYREVRKTRGHFVLLWHNESLSEMGTYKTWRKVYDCATDLILRDI